MAVIKSLGQAGARVLRKLFRRPLPADNDQDSNMRDASTSSVLHDGTGNNIAAANDTSATTNVRNSKRRGNETHHEDTDTSTNTDTETNTIGANMIVPLAFKEAGGPAGLSQRQPHNTPLSRDRNKENRPPAPVDKIDEVVTSVEKLSLGDGDGLDGLDGESAEEDPEMEHMELTPEKAMHLKFIAEALDMARLALRTNETPVGCVLVHDGKVIARGMNATNVTRNGTRHAEFMALSALLSYHRRGAPKTTCLKPKIELKTDDSESASVDSRQPDEGNEDGSKGHLYPYGQREHPDDRVDRSIIQDCVLYVTVEPCVMCASLLRQLKIKKVYFGAVNDKFGGTGGVFSIHANSLPISPDGQTASAHPTPKPITLPDGNIKLGESFPPGGGDGGNVEQGYEIEGGWGRDDAVGLLRRFYVQENGRAPVPRKKEGRAARLAAMMEKDGNGSATSLVDATPTGELDDNPMASDAMAENIKLENIKPDAETKSLLVEREESYEEHEVLKERHNQ